MTRSLKTLFFAAALASTPVLAQPTAPTPPVAPAPPAAVSVTKVTKRISLQFQGRLGDALKKIAEKGGVNLILTGKLDEPAEVFLTDVSAEEALNIVARAHRLHVLREGNIWTARQMSARESEHVEQQMANARDETEEAAREAQEAAREAQEEAREAHQEAMEAQEEARREQEEAREEAEREAREALDEAGLASAANNPQELQKRIQDRIERRMVERSRRMEQKMRRLANGRDLAGYGTIVVEEGQTVENAVSYGGGLVVNGHVEQDAVSFGGPVTLGPKAYVEGDVVAFGGPIEKARGAVVEGDEIAMSGATAGINLARGVRGFRNRDASDDDEGAAVAHRSARDDDGGGLPGFLLWFSALFAVGFVTSMAAPNQMKRMEAQIVKSPLRTGGIGAVSVLALPLLSALLCITIVGIIPVFFFWLLVVPIGMAAGASAIATEIGMRLPLRNIRKTQALVLALGLLILLGLFHIPILGPVLMTIVGLLSLGAISRMMLEAGARRRQGIPEPV